jgi:hypothetical protein
VSSLPNFDRIAELNRRLDEMCREAEEIRARIASARHDLAMWPERRHESRMFAEEEMPAPSKEPKRT